MAMGWDDEFGEAVRAEEPLQARGRDRRWGRDRNGWEFFTWEGVVAHTPAMAVGGQRCEGMALGCRQRKGDHEVSKRASGCATAGWLRGWQPGSKVSMIIIRPPQRGQEHGNWR